MRSLESKKRRHKTENRVRPAEVMGTRDSLWTRRWTPTVVLRGSPPLDTTSDAKECQPKNEVNRLKLKIVENMSLFGYSRGTGIQDLQTAASYR